LRFADQADDGAPLVDKSVLTARNYRGNITVVVEAGLQPASADVKGNEVYRLGDLQLRIMRVLWDGGTAGVAEVQEELEGEPLAYTTVATMLRKMEQRGLVSHREQGRRFIYEPAVSEEDVTRSMADDMVDRLFEGSLSATVTHLLRTREVSVDELDRLEWLINQRKQQED